MQLDHHLQPSIRRTRIPHFHIPDRPKWTSSPLPTSPSTRYVAYPAHHLPADVANAAQVPAALLLAFLPGAYGSYLGLSKFDPAYPRTLSSSLANDESISKEVRPSLPSLPSSLFPLPQSSFSPFPTHLTLISASTHQPPQKERAILTTPRPSKRSSAPRPPPTTPGRPSASTPRPSPPPTPRASTPRASTPCP